MTAMETEKARASAWFSELRDAVCAAFEGLEDDQTSGPHAALRPGRFERKQTRRAGEGEGDQGGGVMSVMREGRCFEKVGVNISTVTGVLAPGFAQTIHGAADNPAFFATGISLVAHMANPHVPAVHMNTRFLNTSKNWFGGGADLNPPLPRDEDTADFHAVLQAACDAHNPKYYKKFKEWCDEYFFLPHRNEARGVGGIFFDYVDTNDWEADFAFTRDIGLAFLDIYPQLIRRHMDVSWTNEQRAHQLQRRGRYVEFNLLYDRGTQFGLKTGGNVEAILMSMPPEVTWP